MNLNDYEKVLSKFFDIKTNYETKYQGKKASIINNDSLSKKEKRKQISKLKIPCVNCKRRVGTIFTNNNRNYKATCGDTKNPCDLNININKQTVVNIDKYLNNLIIENNLREEIIKETKLKYLFGLINDDELSELYIDQKESYTQNLDVINLLKEKILENTNFVEREKNLIKTNKKLFIAIQDLKENMKEYMNTNDKRYLNIAVEIYIETIIKYVKRIRENKYKLIEVETVIEKEDELPNIELLKKKNLIRDNELIMTDGEIVELKVN